MIGKLLLNSYGNEVTPARMEFWFDVFNSEIFEGKLIKPTFVSRRMRGYYGWCTMNEHCDGEEDNEEFLGHEFEIQAHYRLKLKIFLEVMAHEMIHLYQAQIEGNLDMPEPDEEGGTAFALHQEKFDRFGLTVTI